MVRVFVVAAGLALLNSIGGCASRPVGRVSEKSRESTAQESLVGSFHIVYGEREKYYVVPDGGEASVELLFAPEDSSRSFLEFDRKRVRITGSLTKDCRVFRVVQLKLVDKQ